jgi:hypothetical protein
VEFGHGLPWLRSGGVHPRGRVASCPEPSVLCASACVVCRCVFVRVMSFFVLGHLFPFFFCLIQRYAVRVFEKKIK